MWSMQQLTDQHYRERLAMAEKFAGEIFVEKPATVAGRAVENQHGVADDSACIALWRAERAIVHAKLGQRFAGMEMEIVDDEIGFERRRITFGRGLGRTTSDKQGDAEGN